MKFVYAVVGYLFSNPFIIAVTALLLFRCIRGNFFFSSYTNSEIYSYEKYYFHRHKSTLFPLSKKYKKHLPLNHLFHKNYIFVEHTTEWRGSFNTLILTSSSQGLIVNNLDFLPPILPLTSGNSSLLFRL